jgi:hypothetical protein
MPAFVIVAKDMIHRAVYDRFLTETHEIGGKNSDDNDTNGISLQSSNPHLGTFSIWHPKMSFVQIEPPQ